jgi:hypothetical protein
VVGTLLVFRSNNQGNFSSLLANKNENKKNFAKIYLYSSFKKYLSLNLQRKINLWNERVEREGKREEKIT